MGIRDFEIDRGGIASTAFRSRLELRLLYRDTGHVHDARGQTPAIGAFRDTEDKVIVARLQVEKYGLSRH